MSDAGGLRGKAAPSLQVKVVIGLMLVVAVPLAVAAYLMDELGNVAAKAIAVDMGMRLDPMSKALEVYPKLIALTKQQHGEVTQRVAARLAEAEAPPGRGKLEAMLALDAAISAVEWVSAQGASQKAVRVEAPAGARELRYEVPVRRGLVRVYFRVPESWQREYQDLKLAVDDARLRQATLETALPRGYRRASWILLLAATALAALVGALAATRVTRRLGKLVAGARQVATGDLRHRIQMAGRDEIARVGEAFDHMLEELEASNKQVEYLQRIGAWQEVARRLAHEIKNPLTPIQLAVQQCVSTYRGDDARFAGLLQETESIVSEEIGNLRRLVDTFRQLGQLPTVTPTSFSLDELVESLRLEHGDRVHLQAPASPVELTGDKLLLKRVLANLVENGLQAGDAARGSGQVAVKWDRRGEAVDILVDDNGPGVRLEDHERIFEPYVTTKPTGTGLGLAISKKIVLDHRGTLIVSPLPSSLGGARFWLRLPLLGPSSMPEATVSAQSLSSLPIIDR